MINIDNTQKENKKLSNPNEQRCLEREKINKRKSKIFNNIDNVYLNNFNICLIFHTIG